MPYRHTLALRHGSSRAGKALGARTSAKKALAARQNGHHGKAHGAKGGQPPGYRLTADGGLERRDGDTWTRVVPHWREDPPAYAAYRRLMADH